MACNSAKFADFSVLTLGSCYDHWAGGAMKQPVERRLAAILAADVAGYSRLS
jgi:class 3 adenylate cyclase